MATFLGLLIGTILGQRFKVVVLAPAALLILLLAIDAAIVGTNPAWSVGARAAMALVGLQLGYLLGSGIRYLKVLARANRLAALRAGHPIHRDAQLSD